MDCSFQDSLVERNRNTIAWNKYFHFVAWFMQLLKLTHSFEAIFTHFKSLKFVLRPFSPFFPFHLISSSEYKTWICLVKRYKMKHFKQSVELISGWLRLARILALGLNWFSSSQVTRQSIVETWNKCTLFSRFSQAHTYPSISMWYVQMDGFGLKSTNIVIIMIENHYFCRVSSTHFFMVFDKNWAQRAHTQS